ncbi:MAG: right-handed parallel beta-helix repeat-containing protein [Chloroflexota bacterium]
MSEERDGSVQEGTSGAIGGLAGLAARSLADLEASASAKAARGRPLVVAADGSGDVRTIGEGIGVGGAGATLLVRPGVYREALELAADVEIEGLGETSAIRLVGPDDRPAVSVSDGRHAIRRITISGGRRADLEEESWVAGVAAVKVTRGTLELDGVAFVDSPETCVYAKSKYAIANVRDCDVQSEGGYLIELWDGAGGSVERCVLRGRQGRPLVRLEGHQTDVELSGNTLVGGGVLVQDRATPRISGNALTDQHGIAIKVTSGAAPVVVDNRIELRWASGVVVEGPSTGPMPVFERNRITGERYSDAGFRLHTAAGALIIRNHVSGCFQAIDITSTGVSAELRDNTFEDCGTGISVPVEEGRGRAAPSLSISGTTNREVNREFSLSLQGFSSVGPITLGEAPRLDPIPGQSDGYGRTDFAASEVSVRDLGPKVWTSVDELVARFTGPDGSHEVIATLDGPALWRFRALAPTATRDDRLSSVWLTFDGDSCEAAATDNHGLATELMPAIVAVPGTYAIRLGSTSSVASLGRVSGPVTILRHEQLLALTWDGGLIVTKPGESDRPDFERVLSPAPSGWVGLRLGDLEQAMADATTQGQAARGRVWFAHHEGGGVALGWKAEGGEKWRTLEGRGPIPATLRVELSRRYLTQMLAGWPAGDIQLGMVGEGKPVHFRSVAHPRLRYAIMPLRPEANEA